MTERLHFQFSLSCIGEGNGNPLQCSCLQNPRDWGAWWATIYGVAQSRTRLKRLSSSSSSHRYCKLTWPRVLIHNSNKERSEEWKAWGIPWQCLRSDLKALHICQGSLFSFKKAKQAFTPKCSPSPQAEEPCFFPDSFWFCIWMRNLLPWGSLGSVILKFSF